MADVGEETLPLARCQKGRIIKSRFIEVSSALAAAGLVWSLVSPRVPLLVWNASPSSPMGLYAVSTPDMLRIGDTVIAWPPQSARRLASSRRYLPAGVPLVKRIAAVSGERICADRTQIFINGRKVARRLVADPSARPMPWWSGCHIIRSGEIFLLSTQNPYAFDGRYFGTTSLKDVIGRGRLLWRI